MARYERTYAGERRTNSLGIKLTPSERADLKAAAAARGMRLSDYVRAACLSRSLPANDSRPTVNPAAKALAHEISAIGNNLNQLAKIANTVRAVPQLNELRTTTEKVKAALARVIAL